MAFIQGIDELKLVLTGIVEELDGKGASAVVTAAGEVIRDAARENIRQKLNKNASGALEDATVVKIVGVGKAEIGPRGIIYARVHEYGHPGITPKRAKALAFEVDGKLVFAQKVVIPPRPYLRPAADSSRSAAAAAAAKVVKEIVTRGAK